MVGLLALLIVGSRAAITQPATGASPSRISFDHIVVIAMENHGINATYGTRCASNCTYITQLANSYGLAENYSSVAHDSLPNYLTLTSAGNYSYSPYYTDCSPPESSGNTTCPPINAVNLFDRIEASGRSWRAYMEDYTGGGCSLSGASTLTSDRLHTYANNHNPFLYYSDIYTNTTRCSNIVNANPGSTGYLALPTILLSDLNKTTAPSFMWLTPNLCDDGHSPCNPLNNTVLQTNNYLSLLVPKILNSPVFREENSTLFITWDEGDSCKSPGQTYPTCIDRVSTIWAGPVVKTGYKSNTGYSHYSFPKTLEIAWSLQPLTSFDAAAIPMTEFLDPPFTHDGLAGSSSKPLAPLAYSS